MSDSQSASAPTTHRDAPTIALIGCGAIAESFHLPALSRHPEVCQRLVLVDRDLNRARSVAARYPAGVVCGDYHDVLKSIDGAVIATPSTSHYDIALDCVRNGVHILCEKPLAGSVGELNEMVDEARRSGVTVSVNNNRRLFPSFRKVRQLIESGHIGQPYYFKLDHGEKFDWPSATASYFGALSSGKGVLLDIGAHVLDLVCWWLGGKPHVLSYRDDSFGGAEAVARLSLEHDTCRGDVHLSWLSRLSNLYRIHGEEATLEVGIYDWRSVTLVSRAGKRTLIPVASDIRKFSDVANLALDNFVDVLRARQTPLVTALDVASSIELINECYVARSRFDLPWHETLWRITA